MERIKGLILLGSFVLILIVNAVRSLIPTECANLGEFCSSNLQRTCCGENLTCTWSDSAFRNECKKKAILGDTCRSSIDCSTVLHSTCSPAKKCVCRLNNIQVSNHICKPLLGEFCWRNEKCAPANSVCVENICQCNDGFLAQSNDRCLPELLGSHCDDNAACETIKFAKCSSNMTCTCSEDTIAISRISCSIPLGGLCITESDCGITFSSCIDNICQCNPEYSANSNNECRVSYLGMFCQNSAQCKDHKNSACIKHKCQCTPNYVMSDSKCLPKYLNGSCETTSDCSQLNSAICSNGKCVCNDGFFTVNQTICAVVLGEACSIDRDCSVRFSHCSRNRCKCNVGYMQFSEKECLATQIGSFCFNDSSCNLIFNARCADNQCVCKDNHVEIHAIGCMPLLNESCSTAIRCAPKNSICIDQKCQCEFNYLPKSNNECVPKLLEKECNRNIDCMNITNAKCADAGKCTCYRNYVQTGPRMCRPLLGGYCMQDDQCVIQHSTCLRNKCVCSANYFPQSNLLCSPVSLGQFCETDQNCVKISNAKCSEEKKCVCKTGYMKFDESVCLALIDGICTDNKDCYVYNSTCIDNTCQCLEINIPLSPSKCVSTALDTVCYSSNDCLEITNSHCSRFNLCACNSNYISEGGKKCMPALGQVCSENTSCTIANTHCIDDKCQCMPNFVNGLYNECLPTFLRANCETDDDCLKIKHAKCLNNKCVCKNNYIALNTTTCAPLLNGVCSGDKDCYDDNTVCIDNKCQCNLISSVQVLNKCELITLGRQCKTNTDCRSIQKATCSINKICICESDTFALNNTACTNFLDNSCSDSNDCGVESSHCFENKCQCKPSWVAISQSQCVKYHSQYNCEKTYECGEPWHFECLDNYCTCKSNNVAVHVLSCLPILGGSCWRDDQCMTENSVCIDFHCRCKSGFIYAANNICVAY